MSEPIADGFGSTWERCDDDRCDLHVVRPGKSQCSGYCAEDWSADRLGVDATTPRT